MFRGKRWNVITLAEGFFTSLCFVPRILCNPVYVLSGVHLQRHAQQQKDDETKRRFDRLILVIIELGVLWKNGEGLVQRWFGRGSGIYCMRQKLSAVPAY